MSMDENYLKAIKEIDDLKQLIAMKDSYIEGLRRGLKISDEKEFELKAENESLNGKMIADMDHIKKVDNQKRLDAYMCAAMTGLLANSDHKIGAIFKRPKGWADNLIELAKVCMQAADKALEAEG